jgi:hypothetical protein
MKESHEVRPSQSPRRRKGISPIAQKGPKIGLIPFSSSVLASISISHGILRLRKCHSVLTPFSFIFHSEQSPPRELPSPLIRST